MHHRPSSKSKTKRILIEAVESRLLLTALPHLVKDLNLVPTRPTGHIENITPATSDPANQPADFVYFTAFDRDNGTELWRSDGSAAGTYRIKDINPGPDGSSPSSLTMVGDTLFFAANDGVHGTELWMSDGSSGGTQLVKNIRVPVDPTTEVPNPPDLSSSPFGLANIGGTLYFQANDGINGAELWSSDGSDSGTNLYADINPTPGAGSSPTNLMDLNGSVVYRANDGVNGMELFINDHLLANINPGSGSSVSARFAAIVSNGTLFFTANDGSHGVELWKSFGTEASTTMVSDVLIGSGSAIPSTPALAADDNGNIFFSASDGIKGIELWVSVGGSSSVNIVKDIFPLAGSSNPTSLTNVNGTIFFAATDGTQFIANGPDETGTELWKVNGTNDAELVKNIRPDPTPTTDVPLPLTLSSNPANFFVFNDQLYFQANDGVNGIELWTSDGSESGTVMVKDIRPEADPSDPHPPSPSSSPNTFATANGLLFFQADDGVHGGELWTSDGSITDNTNDGTNLVTDIYLGTDNLSIDSNPSRFANVNGTLFFTGTFGNGSVGLWKTNGTSAGTVLLKDFIGATGNPPLSLAAVGSTLYFSAYDPDHGYELWSSDGTPDGTVLFKNIRTEVTPGTPLSSTPNNLFNYNGTLIFTANDGTGGTELWKSDGTDGGTSRVMDIFTGSGSSNPNQFTQVDNTLFFVATDNTHGYELWSMSSPDSTPQRVTDINPGSLNGLDPTNSYLTVVGGTSLYFRGTSTNHGSELWLTGPGVSPVESDINPGSASSSPVFLTNLNGTVYFFANDGTHGNELWYATGGSATFAGDVNKTPGTVSGTTLGASDTSLFIAAINNKIVFAANDGITGTELWTFDSAASAPTRLLSTEFNPSTGTTYYGRPIVYNGALYFVADDGTHGRELYSTNGLAGNISIISDIRPGIVGSIDNNSPMLVVGLDLYFIPNDGLHGAELWHFNNSDIISPTATSVYDFQQGKIVMSFSEDVSDSVQLSDINISLLPTATTPAGPTFHPDSYVYDSLTNTATFSFPNNYLANGNYHVSVNAADITDPTLNPLSAPVSFDFYVLNGDANRDRVVNAKDLGILSANWQKSIRSYSQGDFNYDGRVDISDLYLLASSFGQTLAPYVPPPAAPASLNGRKTPVRAPVRVAELVNTPAPKR